MISKAMCILGFVAFFSCSDNEKSVELVEPDLVPSDSLMALKENFINQNDLVINEIQVGNVEFKDEFGEDPGWIELYNKGDHPIQLAGYSLAEKEDKEPWVFDSLILAPKNYLLVYCSGRDQKRRIEPKEPVYLMSTDIQVWADEAYDNLGHSVVSPFVFAPKYTGRNEEGDLQVSGIIQLRDNKPEFDWSSAQIMMGFTDIYAQEVYDLSEYDYIKFRAKITEGEKLQIRTLEEGLDDWLGWYFAVDGTGDWQDYTQYLQKSKGDKSLWYGLKFERVSNEYGDTKFVIEGITFYDLGKFLHSSFKLEKDKGKLLLKNSRGDLIEEFKYGAIGPRESYGRVKDGLSEIDLLTEATPGTANKGSFSLPKGFKIPLPEISQSSGFYQDSLLVEIKEYPGLQSFYTVDGSVPDTNSHRYQLPLMLRENTVLRVKYFTNNSLESKETVRNYLFDAPKDLPVVFISTEDSLLFDEHNGIYRLGDDASFEIPYFGANFWAEKEIPVHIEWFEDGESQWNSQTGLRIFGGWSRAGDKKSVAIQFNEVYGQSWLNYPLFPNDPELLSFKSFVLRNNGNNNDKGYIRDGLMTNLLRGLSVDVRKFRPAVVYYNGKYWGIHNLREKINAAYFETNYGVQEENLDLIKDGGEYQVGSGRDYDDFIDWAYGQDLNIKENWSKVDSAIDVQNFLNYLAAEVFFNNGDWPANNKKIWRDRGTHSKWKHVVYDMDFGFGGIQNLEYNMIEHIMNTEGEDWPNGEIHTRPIRMMMKSDFFKYAFIHRLGILMSTRFSADTTLAMANKLWAEIDSEIEFDQERWNLSEGYFEESADKLREFAQERAEIVYEDMGDFFELGERSLLSLDPKGGVIYLSGYPIRSPVSLDLFNDVPLHISYEGPQGQEFSAWSDGSGLSEREIILTKNMKLTVQFK